MPKVKSAMSHVTTHRDRGRKSKQQPAVKSADNLPTMKAVVRNITSVAGRMKLAVQPAEGKSLDEKRPRQLCEKCKKRKRESDEPKRSIKSPGPSHFSHSGSNSSPGPFSFFPSGSTSLFQSPSSPLSLPDYNRNESLLEPKLTRKHSLSSMDKFERYISHLQKNNTPGAAYKKSKDVVDGIAANLWQEHREKEINFKVPEIPQSPPKSRPKSQSKSPSKSPPKSRPESPPKTSPKSPPKTKRHKPNTSPIRNCGIYALSSEVNPKAYDYSSMAFFKNAEFSESYSSLELPSEIFDQTTVSIEHDESMSIIQTDKSLFIGVSDSSTSAAESPKKSLQLSSKRKTDSIQTTKQKHTKKACEPSAFDNPFKPGKEWQSSKSKKLKQSTPKSSTPAGKSSIFKSPEEPKSKTPKVKSTKNITQRKANTRHGAKKRDRHENFNCNSNSNSSAAMFEIIVTPELDSTKAEQSGTFTSFASSKSTLFPQGSGIKESFSFGSSSSSSSSFSSTPKTKALSRSNMLTLIDHTRKVQLENSNSNANVFPTICNASNMNSNASPKSFNCGSFSKNSDGFLTNPTAFSVNSHIFKSPDEVNSNSNVLSVDSKATHMNLNSNFSSPYALFSNCNDLQLTPKAKGARSGSAISGSKFHNGATKSSKSEIERKCPSPPVSKTTSRPPRTSSGSSRTSSRLSEKIASFRKKRLEALIPSPKQ